MHDASTSESLLRKPAPKGMHRMASESLLRKPAHAIPYLAGASLVPRGAYLATLTSLREVWYGMASESLLRKPAHAIPRYAR